MATEQDIEDTDAVISDNDTSTVFPDGTPAGDFDASGNPYDNPYQLHRPHAFALMHGDGGAKISYGELHWRVDLLKFKFETHTVSGISVTVDDHANHSHAPHDDHSHADHTDHPSHTHEAGVASHTHNYPHTHTHDHTHELNHVHSHSHAHTVNSHSHTITSDSGGSGYSHNHGGTTSSESPTTGTPTTINTDQPDDATTDSISSTTTSTSSPSATDSNDPSASGTSTTSGPNAALSHSSHSGVKTTSHGTPASTSGILKHSGVTTLDSDGQGTSSDASGSSSGVLSHNVTVSGSSSFVYCAQAGQESIGKINQQVPKVDVEDGKPMSANINDLDEDGIPTGAKYHQLGSYGDVYLCWKADLEQGAGSEITHCWVQVGEPDNDDIDEVPLGNSSTNRRSSSGSDGITGANDNGIYSIKLGTVNEGSPIKQNVSSDVVWTPTVIDRIGP